MLNIRIKLLCAGLLSVLLSGCGGSDRPPLEAATGTVTLNGEPLEGAMVALQPVADDNSRYQRPSRGVTDAQGKFTVGTYGADDGIPAGRYKVGVLKREVVGELPENYNAENESAFNIKYQWITPRSYSDPETSGLTVEVSDAGLIPPVLELQSQGAPEIEMTGPQSRRNEP